jgi:UPF0176 protein
MTELIVAALYKFAPLTGLPDLRSALRQRCGDAGLCGTLIIAPEGINGTVAGSRQGIDDVLAYLRGIPGLEGLEHKESRAATPPFYRMKVRIKKEIVTLGVEEANPNLQVGTYVEPEDWNALIADPDVVLIDTRNAYEVEIGSFPGAVNPQTGSFREFPRWFGEQAEFHPGQKFAMFCTGGIRCEKATALLKQQGFDEVFHLKGGILKYLETVPPEESRWEGECFVFDQRTALTHGNDVGSHALCHACRNPLSAEDRQSPLFREGVSCPRCHGRYSDEQMARFAERQRQMERAARRGERHLGTAPKKHPKDTAA